MLISFEIPEPLLLYISFICVGIVAFVITQMFVIGSLEYSTYGEDKSNLISAISITLVYCIFVMIFLPVEGGIWYVFVYLIANIMASYLFFGASMRCLHEEIQKLRKEKN